MLRSKTYWFALALLTISGASAACSSGDLTGPAQETTAFEKQGPNHEKQGPNHEKQGPNHEKQGPNH